LVFFHSFSHKFSGKVTQEFALKAGKILSKYLEDEDNLMVISSDFCHWGTRFSYTYYEKQCGAIYKSIEHIDKLGMKLIESLDSESFMNYIKTYKNTICGRHPIYILMKVSPLNFLMFPKR
jgi:MEMO1 family protein